MNSKQIISRGYLLSVFFFLLALANYAQQKVVSGTVNSTDGPLFAVNILVKGSARGTQTDFDGNYSIQVAPNETLVFSFVGYKSKELQVGSSSTIDVTLVEDASQLDEVLIVAFGTSTKESFTGSSVQISADDISNRGVTSALNAIDGKAAGVNLTSSSGAPGSSPTIQIRGIGSINASNDPLIVLDGSPYTGQLSSINPNDIESFSILKDAASSSLYGSRAANGVVLITTKRGNNRKSQFTFNSSVSVVSRGISEYDRVNANQYYPLMWEALRNSNAIPGINTDAELATANTNASNTIFNQLGYNPFNVANDQIVLENGQLNPNATLLYPDDLDWQKPLIGHGVRNNYDMTYSGGGENSDYYASLGYIEEDGYLLNSDFKRFTTRVNANSQVANWLKLGVNLSGASESSLNQSGGSNAFVNPFRTRYVGPIYPVYVHDETGAFVLDENGERIFDIGRDRVGGGVPGRHVIQETLLNVNETDISTLSTRAYADFTIAEGLKASLIGSLDKRFLRDRGFDNPIVGDGAPAGRASRQSSERSTINFGQTLNYTKGFGVHNFDVLIGHESFDDTFEFLSGSRQGQSLEGNTELINFVTTNSLTSYTQKLKIEGYFSRLNYDFDNRYFISGSYRRDGTSRFDEDVRWGDFYSVSTAWNAHNESFLENADWINFLKLRGSYGEVGNQSLGTFYESQALFELGNNNASETGILFTAPGNPNLKWERNQQFDVALEFGFFNNRVSGTVEYYNRKSKDLLFQVPLPLDGGVLERPDNVGTMKNYGVEFDVSVDIFKKNDFSWNFSFNGATLNNEITELPQEEIINGTKKLVVGGDIYAYWLRDWYGVDPSDGSALYIASQEAIDANDTDLRTVNGVVVTTDQNDANFDFVGTAIPDLYGGFSNAITYKQFTFSVNFKYQLGGQTYDSNYQGLMHAGTYGTALHTDILNRWQQPGDITDVPRLDASRLNAFGAASDRWLIDTDFLNFRQATLAYKFDAAFNQKIGIKDLTVYVNGENLYLWTKRNGLDAGDNFNGTSQNRYTPARIISAGFNLTF